MVNSLFALAWLARSQGEYNHARVLCRESLASARALNDQELLVTCTQGLAMLVSAQGKSMWAARLWGAAEVLRETIGQPLSPVERAFYESAIMDTRRLLGERTFAAAWEGGRKMTPDQAFQEPISITAIPSSPSIPVGRKKPISYPAGLSPREVEVLRLVAQGMTNERVADQLIISPRTVDTHLTSTYGKIGVSSRSAATRYAIENHLV
jgi:DNA-binding CsgD family transcriptional regulator